MKRGLIFFALTLACAAAAAATQWGPKHLVPGVNSGNYSWPIALTANGDFYRQDTSGRLYVHHYEGSYTWSSDYTQCDVEGGHMTIDPSGRRGFVSYGVTVYSITSTDGINWVLGESLPAWNRSGEECYPAHITCAWRGGGEWLYVLYHDMYDDYAIWAGPSPYDKPRSIELYSKTVTGFTARLSGDYMVYSTWGTGPYLDLFEADGFGASWGSPRAIGEVNTSHAENYPLLGKLEGKNILFWLDGADFKIYYSVGDATPAVQPSSIGKVKALFR